LKPLCSLYFSNWSEGRGKPYEERRRRRRNVTPSGVGGSELRSRAIPMRNRRRRSQGLLELHFKDYQRPAVTYRSRNLPRYLQIRLSEKLTATAEDIAKLKANL